VTAAGTGLGRAVAGFAAQPRVLVAVDFDGTLSPFVLDPMQARAVPGSLEALRAAAALDGVSVAIVSGRDLATLETLTGIGRQDGITLVGSHGAQTNLAGQTSLARDGALLDQEAAATLSLLRGELESIRARFPSVRLEQKPAAVALHTRGIEPSVAAAATTAVLEVGQRYPRVHVMPGKNVVELTVLEPNKGAVVVELARVTGSDATLYVGDDVTDERAFSALDPESGDLTVKVGDGETLAAHRVPDQTSVVELLDLFVSQRSTTTPSQDPHPNPQT
jgi:trehalose 6-phosphate phosphatase